MKKYYHLFCTKLTILLLVLCSSAAIAQLPTVRITSPANNSVFTAPATINLAATISYYNGPISKVEFFAGSTKLGEDLTAPYTYTWMGAAAGTYQLTAKATISNTIYTSLYTSVRIDKPGVPTVSITSPAHGSVINFGTPINITAMAADVDGSITKVEFFNDITKVKLGEDLTAPYTFSWTGVAVGSYGISAKATDNSNNTTTSARVIVGVKDAYPPTVSITSPTPGATFTDDAPILIKATAADANGTITKVEFFNGGTKLGEDLTAPYSYNWTRAKAGTYRLTAKATDNTNTTSTSAEITGVMVTYCTPVHTRDCATSYTYINNFNFNTLQNNNSGCGSATGIKYTNYPATGLLPLTTTVLRGRSYPISMQSGSNMLYFGVWIDYNRDFDFDDAGEFVYASPNASSLRFSATIPIPATTTLGKTRIRVRSSIGSGPINQYQPCASTDFYNGETEDYTITIASSTMTLGTNSISSKLTEEPEKYAGRGNTFQSYPNPFTTQSTLAFAFDQEEEYEIRVYDGTGTFVKALPKGQVKANTLVQVQWADTKVPTGIYFIKMTSKQRVQTIRVVRE